MASHEFYTLPLHDALPIYERVHAYTHLSHVYRQACSVYSTFVWRLCGDPDRELERWQRFKQAVSGTIVKHGDRKSTRLNSSHVVTSYAGFCLKKKTVTMLI